MHLIEAVLTKGLFRKNVGRDEIFRGCHETALFALQAVHGLRGFCFPTYDHKAALSTELVKRPPNSPIAARQRLDDRIFDANASAQGNLCNKV